jgi:hypothetical protein
VGERPAKHAARRLAGRALEAAGAAQDQVEPRTCLGQARLQFLMDGGELLFRHGAASDFGLIGAQGDAPPGAVQAGDGLGRSRNQGELVCTLDVVTAIDHHDPVAIEEKQLHCCGP